MSAVAISLVVSADWVRAAPIAIAKLTRTEPVDFQKEIVPILQKKCLACHSDSERQGDLVLETPRLIQKGGDTSVAVVPGKGAESLLLKLASHQQEPFMPPPDNDVAAEPLTSQELGLIKLWIDQGAQGNVQNATLSPKQWRPLPPGVNPIYAVCVTPDGQYVACSRANQIFIYYVPTGQLITRLTDPTIQTRVADPRPGVAHLDLVQSLAFNRDGNMLASGGFRTVKLWRRPGDVMRLKLTLKSEAVNAVAVSPDRKTLAVAADNDVQLWTLANGTLDRTLQGHAAAVSDLRFALDGTHLYSSSLDKSVRVWSLAEGTCVGRLDAPAAIHALELVAPAARPESGEANVELEQPLLAVADDEKLIRLFRTPELPRSFPSIPAAPTAAVTSHDCQVIAVVGSDGNVRILNPAGEVLQQWQVPGGPVASIAIHTLATQAEGDAVERVVATAGTDGVIRLWNCTSGEPAETITASSVAIHSLAFHPDGKHLASGDADGSVSVWNLGDTASEPTESDDVDPSAVALRGFTKSVTSLAFHPNGQTVYGASLDGTLRGFGATDGKQTFAARHAAPIYDLSLSPDGQLLVTAGADKTIKVWNSGNGQAVGPNLTGFNAAVHAVAFDHGGTRVIGGSAAPANEVLAFDLATRTLEQRFVGHANAVRTVLGMTGDRFATLSADGWQGWSLSAVKKLAAHTQPVTSLAVLPTDRKQLFSAGMDGTIRHWNVETGRQIRQFNHGGPVHAIAMRPDGKRLASAGRNKSVKLWDAQNGRQIAELQGDLRAKSTVTRLTQDQTAAVARRDAAKRVSDAAEKDLPVKTAAAKAKDDAVKAANKDVATKSSVVKTTESAKLAAEKMAIEAAAAAQQATLAKVAADRAAADAAKLVALNSDKAGRLAKLVQQFPDDPGLLAAKAEADKAIVMATEIARTAKAAQAAPAQAVSETAQAVSEAAAKVTATQKPYNDAITALRPALATQKTAIQLNAIAARELREATEFIPVAKANLMTAEAALVAAQQALQSAQQAAAAAEQPQHAVVFSPDGQQLATGGDFPAVHYWDAETGTAVSSFVGQEGPIRCLTFVSNNELVSGSADRSVVVWETTPGWELARTIGDVNDPSQLVNRVLALDFNPAGTQLATGSGEPSRSGEVRIWNVGDGALVRAIQNAHEDMVHGVRFSPDGKRIASCGADRYVRTFDAASGEMHRRFEGHTQHVLSVAWQGDGQVLASAGAEGVVKIWNAQDGDQMRTVAGFAKQVTSLRFVGDTTNFVAASGDKIVRIIRATNGGTVRNFGGAAEFMHSVDVTPDGAILVAGGHDSVLRIWNGANGQTIKTLEPPAANDSDVTKP